MNKKRKKFSMDNLSFRDECAKIVLTEMLKNDTARHILMKNNNLANFCYDIANQMMNERIKFKQDDTKRADQLGQTSNPTDDWE